MPDLKLNEKLEDINDSKQAIKQALIDKGQNPTNVLSTYADLIENISGGGPITQEEYDRMLEKSQTLLYGEPIVLPYTKLEYIESTGTQYINTNITISDISKIDIVYELVEVQNGQCVLGEAGATGDVTQCWYFYGAGLTGTPTYWGIEYGGNSGVTLLITGDNSGNKHIIITNKYLLSNDTAYSQNNLLQNNNKNLHICYNSRFTGDKASIYLYTLKIYGIQDNLLQNLIPVKRKSDNEVCMYDLVTKQFFTNVGTGDFIAGPEVED